LSVRRELDRILTFTPSINRSFEIDKADAASLFYCASNNLDNWLDRRSVEGTVNAGIKTMLHGQQKQRRHSSGQNRSEMLNGIDMEKQWRDKQD
jgi:hypothetical protein